MIVDFRKIVFGLAGLLGFLMLGCFDAEKKWSVTKSENGSSELTQASTTLADGVYPAIWGDNPVENDDPGLTIVELENVPVQGETSPPATIRVVDRPLLQFRHVPKFDFTFEENECTRIGFANTQTLKAYSKEHIGTRLAVVIDNRVISVHKIREAIESDQVQITCCTVGGGDHLHSYLKQLKIESDAN